MGNAPGGGGVTQLWLHKVDPALRAWGYGVDFAEVTVVAVVGRQDAQVALTEAGDSRRPGYGVVEVCG